MNYLMPEKGSSHGCSANMGIDRSTCLFFGLSGTGKTTLSADPYRKLIGDDRHGWGKKGVFSTKAAVMPRPSAWKSRKRKVWDALRFGSILENVVLDKDGHPDYFNDSLTNTGNLPPSNSSPMPSSAAWAEFPIPSSS